MSNTTVAADNVVTNFLSKYFVEHVRGNLFSKYTGMGENNVVIIKEGAQIVSIPLVAKLSGNGVSGSQTLDGNEEILANYAHTLTPTYRRNAVRLTKEERKKPNIDLMKAGRGALMNWGLEVVRDDIIKAMGSVSDGTNVRTVDDTDANYDSTADTWVTNNSDRVLFGAATGNLSAGDFSASLANVDTSADKLTGDIVRLVRKIAREANPIIRPIRAENGVETYVLFCGTQAFLHLKEDLETLHADSETRGKENPLYTPGDLIWDNVVIREIPEITTILANSSKFSTAGAASAKVEPAYLCGAQAVGYGLGAKPNLVVDREKDFKFQPGVAVELDHDIDKLTYNNKDHGILSLYVTGE